MELFTGTGVSITVPDVSGSPLKAPWDTVIHRGWVAGAKENTLPAMWLTKENGYDWAECDIRVTADNVPVLAHDATVTSEDSATILTVAESTLAQLQAITLQTHSRFGIIKVATLKEVLDTARLIGLNLLLDFKNSALHTNAEHNRIIARTVLESGWADHVVYMPLQTAMAAEILTVDHNASFDFVVSYASVDDLPDLAAYQALRTGGNTVGFDFSAGNAGTEEFTAVLQTVRAAGLSASFWNVSAGNYTAVMDAGPLRITKHNGSDSIDLDTMYLNKKTYW